MAGVGNQLSQAGVDSRADPSFGLTWAGEDPGRQVGIKGGYKGMFKTSSGVVRGGIKFLKESKRENY